MYTAVPGAPPPCAIPIASMRTDTPPGAALPGTASVASTRWCARLLPPGPVDPLPPPPPPPLSCWPVACHRPTRHTKTKCRTGPRLFLCEHARAGWCPCFCSCSNHFVLTPLGSHGRLGEEVANRCPPPHVCMTGAFWPCSLVPDITLKDVLQIPARQAVSSKWPWRSHTSSLSLWNRHSPPSPGGALD